MHGSPATAESVDEVSSLADPTGDSSMEDDKENEGIMGGVTQENLENLERRLFRELAIEATEDEPHEESECSDFQGEGLSERLEERIQQNADGRYDFEIYVDPENR